jgi:hypothetical protein
MLLTQTVSALKAGQFEAVSALRRGDAATEILEYAEAQEVNLASSRRKTQFEAGKSEP